MYAIILQTHISPQSISMKYIKIRKVINNKNMLLSSFLDKINTLNVCLKVDQICVSMRVLVSVYAFIKVAFLEY